MSGFAQSASGYRVGFGAVEGRVIPAGTAPSAAAAINSVGARYRDFKLFGYWRSSCSWRVRIALALKGVAYEYVPVDLSQLVGNTNKTLPVDFLRLNPMGQVPLLQFIDSHDGSVKYLTQSLPIVEFIDEVFPACGPRLLPTDPLLRARVRQIAEIVNSGVQPIHNIRNLRQIKSAVLIAAEEEVTVDAAGFAKDGIATGMASLEALVCSLRRGKASAFAAGSAEPTLADLCIPPLLYSAKRFGVDTLPFASLGEVDALCAGMAAFAAAAPERQIDAPRA